MAADPSDPPRHTVLLTGASGVVGQALLDELSDDDLICLTHRRQVHGHRVRAVHGDVRQPLLGLGAREYDTLASQIDAVVHCAAVTGFSAGFDAANDVNVRGTAAVLALAERAAVPVHYVSTAFVARRELTRDGRREQAGTGVARPADYLDSKRAAERLVRDSGVPANIIRLAMVLGDSASGRIAQFQGLHTIAGAILRNALPLLPMLPDARVDFLPQDLVARAIAGLLRGGSTGGEYWVTAGEAALTAGRAVDLAMAVGADLGLRLDAPRLVGQHVVDRLIRPVFIDPMPAETRRRFDDLVAMCALFCTPEPFDCSRASIPAIDRLGTADLEASWVASLRYFARAKGLAGTREAVA